MRKWILLAALTAGIFSMASLNASRADAMTIGNAAGLSVAAGEASLAQNAAYVCRRVWRCGPWGCGWRRACWWAGPGWGWHRGWGWHHRWHH